MSLRFNKRAFFVFILVILLYLSLVPGFPIGGLLDDLVPSVFMLFWFKNLFKVRKSQEMKTFLGVLIICALGMLSNVESDISRSISDILLDMYSFLKMYFVFWGTKSYFFDKEIPLKRTMEYLGIFSEIFLLISFIFGVLHYLGFVSMGELERYGLMCYAFIYENASQFAILVGVALSFVIYEKFKYRKWFIIMGLITLIMTLKGMAFIIVGVYVSLCIMRVKRIEIWHLAVVAMVLALLLRFQIYGYILNSSAPRAMLLKYGLVTANKYFPLGSGFGTYGSHIAAKHYSPLYLMYGFSSRKILTYGAGSALNDVYLGMIFGQFGWIAVIVFCYVFVLIGQSIIECKNTENSSRIIAIGLFACLCGMAIMAGSIKAAGGQLLLFSIQLFLCKYGKRQSIRFIP